MGIGVVVRDHCDEVHAVLAASRSGIPSAVIAECWALLRAVTLCHEIGLRCVQFEGDVKLVVDAVNRISVDCSWYGQLIEDIKGALMDFQYWSVMHVNRHRNRIADAAAKLGLKLNSEQVWLEEEPTEVTPFVILDKSSCIL
ncbi:uncharacterized protein LOC121262145 [Juglans microcarpa x Juglans regia]|uniref:uncharacterized protein LOC121262145 n=1 Tax=Juglans microcarpa x Juglans regia TaxID=2249226 RepID=UPI001B7DC398|nr:uncharacterized protein LOC121262145 [Juglans microcarpa x Juglans regia]